MSESLRRCPRQAGDEIHIDILKTETARKGKGIQGLLRGMAAADNLKTGRPGFVGFYADARYLIL